MKNMVFKMFSFKTRSLLVGIKIVFNSCPSQFHMFVSIVLNFLCYLKKLCGTCCCAVNLIFTLLYCPYNPKLAYIHTL